MQPSGEKTPLCLPGEPRFRPDPVRPPGASWFVPAGLAALLLAGPLHAHPLGNDSITHFSVLHLHHDRIELDLLLDLAENPSQAALRAEMDADGDGVDSPLEQNAWLDRKAVELAADLHLRVDDRPWPLKPVNPPVSTEGSAPAPASRFIMKMPGFANMPTYRLMIRYVARPDQPLAPGIYRLVYEDATYPRQPGLARILLDRPGDLEALDPRPPFWNEGENPFIYEQYDPAHLPQERRGEFRFRVAAPVPATETPLPRDTPASEPALSISSDIDRAARPWPPYVESFTDPRNDPARTSLYQSQARRLFDMMSAGLGPWTLLLLTLTAFTWGAAHALMPGHAKTVVAAYLISRHGTYAHAVLLAVIVTVTHTALVVILGLCVVLLQGSHPGIGPLLQLWLGLLAGLLVAGMGVRLAWQAVSGHAHHHHHHHHHDHPQDHPTGPHAHARDGHQHAHPSPAGGHVGGHHPQPGRHDGTQRLSLRMVCALGVAGGIVPCPTATILILLGIGADMVLQALYAVAVFSLGLAMALMAVGLLALTSRRYAARLLRSEEHEHHHSHRWLDRLLPCTSGLVVALLGLLIASNYACRMTTGAPLVPWLG